jgi:hypothetical protein
MHTKVLGHRRDGSRPGLLGGLDCEFDEHIGALAKLMKGPRRLIAKIAAIQGAVRSCDHEEPSATRRTPPHDRTLADLRDKQEDTRLKQLKVTEEALAADKSTTPGPRASQVAAIAQPAAVGPDPFVAVARQALATQAQIDEMTPFEWPTPGPRLGEGLGSSPHERTRKRDGGWPSSHLLTQPGRMNAEAQR